jgi:hypothetical protein
MAPGDHLPLSARIAPQTAQSVSTLFDGHDSHLFGRVACRFGSSGWEVTLANDRHSTGARVIHL